MRDIRLIAAIGRHGQIGLGDKLPWHDPTDLAWFRAQTMGATLIIGKRTRQALPPLPGRSILQWQGEDPAEFLDQAFSAIDQEDRPNRTVFIAGGAKTYSAFLPFVRTSIITHIDYDGPATAYMPALWA